MSYSERALSHFHQPRRVGELPEPRGFARRENPVCGDVAEFYLQVQGGRVSAVRFRAFGCVAAIAACSCLADWCEGQAVEAVRALTVEDLLDFLGGLPATKKHGASLALETFRAALGELNLNPIDCSFGGDRV